MNEQLRNKLYKMLEMQEAMNRKINPDWLFAGYPFLRANVVEGAEAMEHYGWKWWKNQIQEDAQFAMELVDIWHFTLSHFVVEARGNLRIACDNMMEEVGDPILRGWVYFDGTEHTIAHQDTIRCVELLIGLSVARRTSIPLFERLLKDAGMDWNSLYVQYVGKNVLNFFRQDHGYKDGTYQKIWHGEEDNVHLVRLMHEIDDNDPAFDTELYRLLSATYDAVVNTKSQMG